MLRLHVVDGEGQPVKGLTQDKFSLSNLVSPRPGSHVITDFRETALSEPSSAPHNIIIVLDSNNMKKSAFQRLVKAVAYYIDHLKREKDRVLIVHMDNGMRHLTPFTTSSSVLHEGLASARYQGRLLRDLKIHERRILVKVLALLESPKLQVSERNDVNFLVKPMMWALKCLIHSSIHSSNVKSVCLLSIFTGNFFSPFNDFQKANNSSVEVFFLSSDRNVMP